MKHVCKTIKRIFSFTLALFFLLALFPLSVFASEAVTNGTFGDALVWTLDAEGTLTISGAGAMPDYTYTSHAPWYNSRNTIKGVIIDNGVENIGDFAFIGCSRLESVIIGDNVTCIGDRAFDGCISLDSISIPENVAQIGVMAFVGCKSLSIIYFEGDAPKFEFTQLDGSGLYASFCFQDVTATLYYPEDNTTWTDEIMQDYDGIITWVPYETEGETDINPDGNDVSLYIPVVEACMNECQYSSLSIEKQQECRGLLYDFNGDGQDELVLQYLKDRDIVFEIWSVVDGKLLCVSSAETFSGGLEANGGIGIGEYGGVSYVAYMWENTGMEAFNELELIYEITDSVYELSESVKSYDLENTKVLISSNYYWRHGGQPEGLVLPELISYLQSSNAQSEPHTYEEIPAPITAMVSFNNFFVANYYDNIIQLCQYNSVAHDISVDSSSFQINWNSCLSALSNKEFLNVLELENHPEYYYQTVVFESILQTKLDDDYWSALNVQIGQMTLEAATYFFKYDAGKLLKQKLNTTMTEFSIDSAQYKRLSDYYGQYCKQLKNYETVKDIYDLTVKADGTVEDFCNALSNYASIYGTTQEIVSALEYLKSYLEYSEKEEDRYILTAVNNILTSINRTLDEQLVINCLGTTKDLLWGVFWAAISDAFSNAVAVDIASFTLDSGLTISNVFFPTTISADSYCKLYADYAIEVVTREALNKVYTSYSDNPSEELATVVVGLYDLLGCTYAHEIEVAAVLSEQLHKDGLINGLKNLLSSKNMSTYQYEQECINAYEAYLNDILSIKVEAQTAYGLLVGDLQPVITVYFVNGKVVIVNETTISTGDVYHVSTGKLPLPDFMGFGIEIKGYYLDQQFYNLYEEGPVNKPLSLYCNILLTKVSDGTPVLFDHSTGISISSAERTARHTISTSEITSGSVYSMVEDNFSDSEFELYDISMLENGEQIQPSGEVTVEIPVNPDCSNREAKVYHVSENGEFEDMNAVCSGDVLHFTTNHFSYFVVVYESPAPNWLIPIIIVAVVCGAGVSVIVVWKMRRKRRTNQY